MHLLAGSDLKGEEREGEGKGKGQGHNRGSERRCAKESNMKGKGLTREGWTPYAEEAPMYESTTQGSKAGIPTLPTTTPDPALPCPALPGGCCIMTPYGDRGKGTRSLP